MITLGGSIGLRIEFQMTDSEEGSSLREGFFSRRSNLTTMGYRYCIKIASSFREIKEDSLNNYKFKKI